MRLPKVGVGVLIYNDQEEILLGKRLNAHGEGTWGPPGGNLEWGEDFATCAIREVYEETGLKIHMPNLVGVTNDIFIQEDKHYVSIFLGAHAPSGTPIKNLEPNKVSKWEWFSLTQLPDNLFLPLKNLLSQTQSIIVGDGCSTRSQLVRKSE